MTVQEQDASQALSEAETAAYIRIEDVEGVPTLVLHDSDGEWIAMSACLTPLISFAANHGIRVVSVH